MESKFIRPEEDVHMTLILDGMYERLIFPDIGQRTAVRLLDRIPFAIAGA